MRLLVFYILAQTTLTLPSKAQDSVYVSPSAEKIYLQSDATVYTLDQTIWFKAIMTNGADHSPTQLSRLLHVELIGPDEIVIDKKLVKIQEGVGDGFFDLIEGYPIGRYLVRAYTEWNKNFGEDFIFQQYVDVFPRNAGETIDPLSITLVEREPGNFRLNASIQPLLIDSLHEKELMVYLNAGGTRDTLWVRGGSADTYFIDYPLPSDVPWVSLQLQTLNEYTFTKTIALNREYLDLQFFPESGELIHGHISKVGFKALDYRGLGKIIQGEILDEDENVITSFKSNALGMGSFFLKGDTSKSYYAHLQTDNISAKYPLPEVQALGNTLSITQTSGVFHIVAFSNYLVGDSIFIRTERRGIPQFQAKGKLEQGQMVLRIPKENLPEGIIAFTLLDRNQQPMAERLVFNRKVEEEIIIFPSTDRSSYSQRQETTLEVQTVDPEGKPLEANLSLLVINKNQMGELQTTRQNILSYFLLDSELKGEIQNPGYYFHANTDRQEDLDVLLLTQGWRNYQYAKRVDSIRFQPEYGLNVSGQVSALFNEKKKKEDIELTLMTLGDPVSAQAQTTDSQGRFYFDVPDKYGEEVKFLIQSADEKGKNKSYPVILDEKKAPPVTFLHTVTVAEADNIVHTLVEKQQQRNLAEDAFRLSGVTYLDEVVINDYRLTPEREKVMEKYGKPDKVVDGEAIRAQEEKWSFGLYGVIQAKFPDLVRIRRLGGAGGFLYAYVQGGFGPTLVIIDGITVNIDDYHLVPQIPPSEVKSFEVIKGAKNFSKVYMEALPFANPATVPIAGKIISIYTFAGTGLRGALKSPDGISQQAIAALSPPKEFYAPKYESLTPEDWIKPDLRALIHWDPKIETDQDGKASVSFYNADNVGEMMVVVEAISADGKIGYKEVTYEVLRRDR